MTSLIPLLRNCFLKQFALGILLLALTSTLNGQELNCTVQINYEQVNNINADVFQNMERAITEFMNNQRWTNDVFKPEERIDCNIFINMESSDGASFFSSTISVQCTRPVYGTDYETTIFNFIDQNFSFVYQEDQPLFFVENGFSSNLTSVLGFYAYVVLAFDYDSFSKSGGTQYLDKANEISSFAQQAPKNVQSGWTINDKNSRYELIQDLMNPQFSSFREGLFTYHRLAMDTFEKNPAQARMKILSIIQSQKQIFEIKQQSMLLRIFYMSKSQELTSIFSKANSMNKQKFLDLVGKMDASNLSKYEKINDI